MRRASYNVGADASTGNEEPESKKPDNTAFKQQRLPAWQPILTPKSVFPTFLLVTIVFIPLGAVLLVASNNVIEVSEDYTNCAAVDGRVCSRLPVNESCSCIVNVTVDHTMSGDIYVYYGLSQFFQNHRRYVKSRDDNQLVGTEVTKDTISKDCEPYKLVGETPIAPCGAIANSLFNDSFTFLNTSLLVRRTGIAWTTDHKVKFNNPPPQNDLEVAFSSYARPLFWTKNVSQLDPSDINNNGYKNEAFEVWMRTAAFPTFRKLYGKLNTQNLLRGTYQVEIDYNYPVTAFSGTKRIILSTTSFMGGKNSFLGITYIVVGIISFVVGIGLLMIHAITKKRQQTAG